MNLTEWAKREVEIACKKENPNRKEGEFDYGCACYENALKAYECLMKGGHSGMSFGFTKQILNRLMDGRPLTPIEDVEDIWAEINFGLKYKSYHCTRMSSLFKDVYPDGKIEYHDVDRFICVNINNPNYSYHSGLVDRVMLEMYPITMPYNPSGSFTVYCDDVLTDSKNGDFDTVAIFHVITPDGEHVPINRYFKEGDNELGWVEIDVGEYKKRVKMDFERKANLAK